MTENKSSFQDREVAKQRLADKTRYCVYGDSEQFANTKGDIAGQYDKLRDDTKIWVQVLIPHDNREGMVLSATAELIQEFDPNLEAQFTKFQDCIGPVMKKSDLDRLNQHLQGKNLQP